MTTDNAIEAARADAQARYGEIVELLVAAGYFRARISSLSNYDKVIGGLAWCISSSDVDVDVDVLFQEQATIGVKIKQAESICKALNKMKCAYPLQPQQIQGLDVENLFPVIQWLVKRVMEVRLEQGDTVRKISEFHFGKAHVHPADRNKAEAIKPSVAYVTDIMGRYRPERRYRRRLDESSTDDAESRVRSTLLEYGGRVKLQDDGVADDEAEAKKKAAAAEKARAAEEQAVNALLTQMDKLTPSQRAALMAVSGSNVANIVGLQGDEIRRLADENEAAAKIIEQMTAGVESAAKKEETHKRQVAALKKQAAALKKKYQQVTEEFEAATAELERVRGEADKQVAYNNKVVRETEKLMEQETPENAKDIAALNHLVTINERLKAQEASFRANCKQQLVDWKAKVQAIEQSKDNDEDAQRMAEIEETYEADLAKHQKIRAMLAAKNRALATLERKIDDIPTRTELIQYERRFIELYEQVASKTEETRKYFNTYNTLSDTKTYYVKETSILNSIHEGFHSALGSKTGKDKLLQSIDNIITGVKGNKARVDTKLSEEKERSGELTEQYSALAEKQRAYFKAVSVFQEECHKNEYMLSKVGGS